MPNKTDKYDVEMPSDIPVKVNPMMDKGTPILGVIRETSKLIRLPKSYLTKFPNVFKSPSRKQIVAAKAGRLRPKPFSEKKLEALITNAAKKKPSASSVRPPTTSRTRGEIVRKAGQEGKVVENPDPRLTIHGVEVKLKGEGPTKLKETIDAVSKIKGKARGGPVGYTERWKTGRKG